MLERENERARNGKAECPQTPIRLMFREGLVWLRLAEPLFLPNS